MKFKVPLRACPANGREETVQEIVALEKDCQRIELVCFLDPRV
jgi:hypothetical protein